MIPQMHPSGAATRDVDSAHRQHEDEPESEKCHRACADWCDGLGCRREGTAWACMTHKRVPQNRRIFVPDMLKFSDAHW